MLQHSIRYCLALASTAALTLASTSLAVRPAGAEEIKVVQGTASDLGVMEVSLKDAVQFNWGFQGVLQGAGTPNEAGIGAFIPLHIASNSVAFMDVLVNANFNDYSGYSSIINTDISSTTFSTSTRLGYRWLNGDRSWMLGVNAGYDSRPMATGGTDTGANLTFNSTVFFQQAAASLEASSNKWNLNAFALVPFGSGSVSNGTVYVLNNYYLAGALNTYGFDTGYNVTPDLRASVGYYYQQGDLGETDGPGFLGHIDYNVADGLTVGVGLSYDQAYKTRVSGNIRYRFGSNGYRSPSTKHAQSIPGIQALIATPGNRDVRVHADMFTELLMANGLAFASDTPKAINKEDVAAVAKLLQNNRIALSDEQYAILDEIKRELRSKIKLELRD